LERDIEWDGMTNRGPYPSELRSCHNCKYSHIVAEYPEAYYCEKTKHLIFETIRCNIETDWEQKDE
jgi:hypothetical protein